MSDKSANTKAIKPSVKSLFHTDSKDIILYWLILLIIFIGFLLRLIILIKNNCFILDEVNVVLNVYDRNVLQLFTPLDYDQYAPPGFLLASKFFTNLFGNSEHFYRFYPFLCSVMGLWLLFLVLKRYVSLKVVWYPLLIVAVGFIYIRYAISVKQYSGDIFFTLLLILLALERDIISVRSRKFMVVWMFAGTLAIWFSMPAMFVLASIGLYFFFLLVQARDYKKLYPLIIVGVFCLLQYALYYQILLKHQVNSDYLHAWHERYFLNLFPLTWENWQHNWKLVKDLLVAMGGGWTLSLVFHISMMLFGAVYYLRRYSYKALLIVMPVILCIIAVFLHKYTMISRVMLFALPLLLILVAGGMQAIFNIRNIFPSMIVIACGIISIINFSELDKLDEKVEHEEITGSMKYVVDMGVSGENLYVHWYAVNAFRYYTTIHPGRSRWATIKNANMLSDTTDFEQLAANFKARSAVLYSYEEWNVLESHMHAMEKHAVQVGRHSEPMGWVSIYVKK